MEICLTFVLNQSCRPRSVFSPVFFVLGIQLDHLDWVCVSYIRDNQNGFNIWPYPESVIMSIITPKHFMVWVLSWHGHYRHYNCSKPNAYSKEDPIKRVKRASGCKKLSGLKFNFIVVQRSLLCHLWFFCAAKHLQLVYTIPPSYNLDLLRYSCRLFPDGSCTQITWSGFQQHVNIRTSINNRCHNHAHNPYELIWWALHFFNAEVCTTIGEISGNCHYVHHFQPAFVSQSCWNSTLHRDERVCCLGGFHSHELSRQHWHPNGWFWSNRCPWHLLQTKCSDTHDVWQSHSNRTVWSLPSECCCDNEDHENGY